MKRFLLGTMGLVAWLCLASCQDETVIIGHFRARTPLVAGSDARVSVDGGGQEPAGADAAAPSGRIDAGPAPLGDELAIEPGTLAEFCAARGFALHVVSAATTTSMQPVCTPTIGRRLFRYAVCTCGDVSTSSLSVSIDAFDSRQGAFQMAEKGAPLGINGALRASNPLAVNGSAIVAGRGSLTVGSFFTFDGDLKTNASIDIVASGVLSVGRDLWSDADIHAGLTTSVGRAVYQTPGHVGGDALGSVGASPQTRSFTVKPPCACGDDAEIDVAKLVDRAQHQNDNAALGLSPAALSAMLQRGVLPANFDCGRFALDGLSLPGATLNTLHGRLALFVDGDLTLQGNFANDLEPQAELDLFVSGKLAVTGPAQIGMPARPSALRLYIGSSEPIEISDRVNYAAQLYAPHAPVRVAIPLIGSDGVFRHTYGSIFAASFDVTTLYAMHYDRAILELAGQCDGAPPSHCETCEQCPLGLACVNGGCAACRTDEDCCEPLGCSEGKCQPLMYTPMK